MNSRFPYSCSRSPVDGSLHFYQAVAGPLREAGEQDFGRNPSLTPGSTRFDPRHGTAGTSPAAPPAPRKKTIPRVHEITCLGPQSGAVSGRVTFELPQVFSQGQWRAQGIPIIAGLGHASVAAASVLKAHQTEPVVSMRRRLRDLLKLKGRPGS
jgi:hypothetical protein